ncbi:acyltransferase domain-containing protein, partial [Nocardiopsis sp. LOL_012]|uniref:acyltransferase domain-containing protein n=1 Tax=Nocardiopsis sp. LOL_012 TaxID=3345409 RepID=UPI003A899B00
VPLRAGVSAFGMGGVNAHVVLEEPPAAPAAAAPVPRRAHLLKVTAPTEAALRRLAGDYDDHLADLPDGAFADFVHTADTGRTDHRHRAVLAVADRESARKELRAVASGERPAAAVRNRSVPTAFVFTGQGSQHAGMGRELYECEPVYRRSIDECEALLRPHTSVPLTELLFGDGQGVLDRTEHAQVAIVSTQVALTRLLGAWGIVPETAIGHSLGELAAAWACGVFDLPDLLRLTAVRARLMQAQPGTGAMAAVTGPVEETERLLEEYPRLEAASYNSPVHMTVTGPAEEITRLVERAGQGRARRLNVSHAFHSAHMDGAVGPFADALADTPMNAPAVPLANGLTGQWHTPSTATDPATWAAQIRHPVRFREGTQALHRSGARHFWEVGPQPHLTPHARATADDVEARWHTTLRRNRPEQYNLYRSVADHLNTGVGHLDWDALHADKGGRTVTVPGYPFARRNLSVEPPRRSAPDTVSGHPLVDSMDEERRGTL